MTDYSKGKIYKIKNKFKPELFYIGSTAQTLNERLKAHKFKSKICNSILYNVVRNTNGWKNYTITLIKDFACNDKEELYKEEQVYINALQPNLNEKNAYRTEEQKKEYMKEYYESNKEKIKENEKEYREKNKDEIKEKMSVPITCECGTITQKWNLSNHRKTKKHFKLLNK